MSVFYAQPERFETLVCPCRNRFYDNSPNVARAKAHPCCKIQQDGTSRWVIPTMCCAPHMAFHKLRLSTPLLSTMPSFDHLIIQISFPGLVVDNPPWIKSEPRSERQMDPSPKPPTKFRASCDGCYFAKVKCTKERTTCSRCETLGLECGYSPSQRRGKTRRTKAHRPSTSRDLEWQPAISARPSPMLSPGTPIQTQFDSAASQIDNAFHTSHSDTTLTTWPNSGSMMHELDVNLLAPWRDYLPISEEDHNSLSEISDDLVGLATGTATPTAPSARDQKLLTAAGAEGPPNCHDGESGAFNSCNCFNSLMQALHVMQSQTQRQCGAPTLETMLVRSKDITAHGEALLRCSFTEDSTLTMLFAALVAKYLSFYSSNNIDLVSSTSSPSSGTSFGTSRLTVGKHTIDTEDEERLGMEIMSMELQKLNTLLTKFRGRLSTLPVGYEAHLYESVLNSLNSRLREAMEKLREQKQRLKGEA